MADMLELDKVGVDPKYYPRVNGQPDWLTILRYTEALQSDPTLEMPPIVVVRWTGGATPYVTLDGVHRTRAYSRAGRERIPAVVERLPQSKWLARSVELNIVHGRQLDTGDKAWVCKRLQEEGHDIQAIAKLLKMKVESLEKIVAERCVKLTAKAAEILKEGRSNRQVDGARYGFLKSPLTSAAGGKNQVAALESQSHVSSRDVIGILDSMVAVLRSGVVDMRNEEHSARVEAILVMLEKLK